MNSLGRPFTFAILAYGLTYGCLRAEIYLKSYPSPNERYVVRVYWQSETPGSAITLFEDGKTLWSFRADPEDKPLRVFWRPNSTAFLMEHVTKHGEYRLYIVSIHKGHVKMSPVTIDLKAHSPSIVDGSLVWDQLDAGSASISLTIQGPDSKKHKMRIVPKYCLQPENSAVSSHAGDQHLSELSGVMRRTVKTQSQYKIELDGQTGDFHLRGDVLKDIPEGTRIRVWGKIKSQLFQPKGDSPWPIHWQVFMSVEKVKRIASAFDLPTTADDGAKDANATSREQTAVRRSRAEMIANAVREFHRQLTRLRPSYPQLAGIENVSPGSNRLTFANGDIQGTKKEITSYGHRNACLMELVINDRKGHAADQISQREEVVTSTQIGETWTFITNPDGERVGQFRAAIEKARQQCVRCMHAQLRQIESPRQLGRTRVRQPPRPPIPEQAAYPHYLRFRVLEVAPVEKRNSVNVLQLKVQPWYGKIEKHALDLQVKYATQELTILFPASDTAEVRTGVIVDYRLVRYEAPQHT